MRFRVSCYAFAASPIDRVDKVLRMLRVLRFPICDVKPLPSIVQRTLAFGSPQRGYAFSTSPSDRLDKVLKMLRVLRFLE